MLLIQARGEDVGAKKDVQQKEFMQGNDASLHRFAQIFVNHDLHAYDGGTPLGASARNRASSASFAAKTVVAAEMSFAQSA